MRSYTRSPHHGLQASINIISRCVHVLSSSFRLFSSLNNTSFTDSAVDVPLWLLHFSDHTIANVRPHPQTRRNPRSIYTRMLIFK